MAAQRGAGGVDKKKRAKKRRTRTEVSSSSESDSDDASQKSGTIAAVEDERVKKHSSPAPAPAAAPTPANKEKKNKTTASAVLATEQHADVTMEDAPASPPPQAKSTSKASKQVQEDFGAVYLRKVAAEFADDLDRVREAQDFKASSVPMLIHALKQGESLYTAEERRRVVGAANA